MLQLPSVRINFLHPDAGNQRSIQPIPDLPAGNIHAVQLKIQDLAVAFHAHAQRQGDGHRGSGIITLGVGQGQACPLEGTLKQAHQIQMGDPDRVPLLFKQHSRHRTAPPSGAWTHRNRRSHGGSRA